MTFFLENTCALCPWPQEGPSSEGRSLASDLFVFLAFASSLVFLTPPLPGLTTKNLTQYNYIQPQPLETVGLPMPTIAMRRISPMHDQIQKLLKKQQLSFTKKKR